MLFCIIKIKLPKINFSFERPTFLYIFIIPFMQVERRSRSRINDNIKTRKKVGKHYSLFRLTDKI